MTAPRLIVVTGPPAAGKTTLARELAGRLGLAVLGKDMIKEPLFDALGAGDAAHSRKLSTASFAVQFAMARELLVRGGSLILDGNFRTGEHEQALLAALPVGVDPASAIAQVLCRVDEPLRVSRLRQRSAARHPGHRDAQLVGGRTLDGSAFLHLPGKRIVFDTGASSPPYAELVAELGANSRTV